MRFEKFYIEDSEGRSNCVLRSFCKLYNEDYLCIYKELCIIKDELNMNSFNDVEVFEEYMKRRNTFLIDYGKDKVIRDLKLDNGKYIIFCWDKKEFYHLVPVINNTIYDKNDESLNLYVISMFKVN